MDRFVAMIWDEADESRKARANLWSETLQRKSARWTVVLDAPGLRVLSLIHRGDAPVVTIWQGQDGVIVGPLFARGRENSGRVRVLDQREAERVISTRGDSLIKHYWGNYVALWRDATSGRTSVLRDPCGAVSCFMTMHNGVELFFAHAGDVHGLPGLSFTIDWTYVLSFVRFNYFITKHTGLNEIKELLGGERLEWSPTGEKQYSWAWNGATIASSSNLQQFDCAKDELRATAEACFTAWGTEYRRIMVSLSGGLDSSILVNLLRRTSNASITAQHYLGVGYEQYEVHLARLAATYAGVDLVEMPMDPAKDEVHRVLDTPRLARPAIQTLAVLSNDLAISLADRIGADCFMMGQGGDNLFLQRSIAKHTLADYVDLQGVGRDFWRVAYDAAMLQRCSVWGTVGNTLDRIAFRRAWRAFAFLEEKQWSKHHPIAPTAAGLIPEDYKSHPWITEAARLPHGKADHLMSVVSLYNYYVVQDRAITRDMIYPYMSQPIVEFSLHTPTYVLVHGALDRSLQRHSFQDIIPDAIARRTAKGGASHYTRQVTQHNLTFLRQLILDGEIIQKGWLDRDKIERMLTREHVVHGGGAVFIFLLAAAEAWLNAWRDDCARAVA